MVFPRQVPQTLKHSIPSAYSWLAIWRKELVSRMTTTHHPQNSRLEQLSITAMLIHFLFTSTLPIYLLQTQTLESRLQELTLKVATLEEEVASLKVGWGIISNQN